MQVGSTVFSMMTNLMLAPLFALIFSAPTRFYFVSLMVFSGVVLFPQIYVTSVVILNALSIFPTTLIVAAVSE